jgi:glycosyltransferase involved in cell wall biosynthesis
VTVCGQDDVEILISDNRSEDDTEQVCRDVEARDPRVRYSLQDRNLGLYGNHNFCFDQARGEFVGICHEHDTRDIHIVSGK